MKRLTPEMVALLDDAEHEVDGAVAYSELLRVALRVTPEEENPLILGRPREMAYRVYCGDYILVTTGAGSYLFSNDALGVAEVCNLIRDEFTFPLRQC